MFQAEDTPKLLEDDLKSSVIQVQMGSSRFQVRKNRCRNGWLMGWGIVGRDPPSGLFCISQFELQIGR